MAFASDTVHGLSADVYFDGTQQRVFGDVVISVAKETLPLTANDEGNVNPVDVLRRGENVTVTVPFSDVSSKAVLSGIVFPFASGITGTGPTSGQTDVVLPKAQPGDSFRSIAKELRLVLRDGSATWIFPLAAATEVADLTLSEENQAVYAVTFATYRTTISGVETPFRIVSGSVVSGP